MRWNPLTRWTKAKMTKPLRSTRLTVENLESREVPSASPYIIPTDVAVTTQAILTTGDSVGGYRMAGIPDGLGAFDNGDGTFTLLMNHELGNGVGVTRAHGAKGAFVSEWVINKSDLSVVSGRDLMQTVYGWDSVAQASGTNDVVFGASKTTRRGTIPDADAISPTASAIP